MGDEVPFYKPERFTFWKLFFLSDRRRSKLILERLLLFPIEHWAYFWGEFNSWRFPHGFRDLRPFWWDQKGKKIGERMRKLNADVFNKIKVTIPQKELLRVHNVGRLGGMTNDEYEYWWNVSHVDNCNGIDLTYYERKQVLEKLHWWEDDVFEKIKEIIESNDIQQTNNNLTPTNS